MARRFRFPLETLLKVRSLREREAQRKVAAKSAEIARVEGRAEEAGQEIERRRTELLSQQGAGRLDATAVARTRAWISQMRGVIVVCRQQREKLDAELGALQAELREARRQTKVLEKLRERRWDAYVNKREAHAAAELDELAQQMHTYRGTSSATPDAPELREVAEWSIG